MKEKILQAIREMRRGVGYHVKYIVLNNYSYHKFKHEILQEGNYLTEVANIYDDVAKFHDIPILIKADSHKQEEYIEIIPNTSD